MMRNRDGLYPDGDYCYLKRKSAKFKPIFCFYALKINDLCRENVDYELLKQDEFFIEPTEDYKELFYKSPEYKYQYEGTILLKDMKLKSIYDRFSYEVIPFRKGEDYMLSSDPFYMDMKVSIVMKNT